MIGELEGHVAELEAMRKYPDTLSYIGNPKLLSRVKVSIVGTRKPTPYTRQFTFDLAQKLSQQGVCIVSGAAMGVDSIAHQGAGADNTIAVMGNGLDIRYPAINRPMIEAIETNGLCISPFEPGFKATQWSFVVRNEIVAALGDVLIVAQADLGSGSLRSVAFAQKMGKPIYVLPQRLDESLGTNALLADAEAEAIYDIDRFVQRWAMTKHRQTDDPILQFCADGPTYEAAVTRFGDALFEYELEGKIKVVSGQVLCV
ncbi:MAG: DNA-processing protein DprA [Campylobacterota bacterium]|nr:DNA-processing protein DprA [Campylobacterota bacterium]